MNSPSRKIGIYGGAFDPPHAAHQAIAQAAIEQLGLNTLYVLPTGQAWHKVLQPSAAQHRVAMARLAFANMPQTQVDLRETQRSGDTYTIDTLMEFKQQIPDAQLFLIMGADQFEAFSGWHRWQEIAQIATICVAARASSVDLNQPKVPTHPALAACKMHNIDIPNMPISATDIRKRIRQGLGIDHLVNPEVARYIAQHSLYTA